MHCQLTCREVPFSIAFRTNVRLGLAYEIAHQVLELLLIIDMIINMHKGYYNEQGVLIHSKKAIRVKYFSENFIIDLLAAIPFNVLVRVRSYNIVLMLSALFRFDCWVLDKY